MMIQGCTTCLFHYRRCFRYNRWEDFGNKGGYGMCIVKHLKEDWAYNYIPLRGQIKAQRCGITWIHHELLLSSPGYTTDVCGLFDKTHQAS